MKVRDVTKTLISEAAYKVPTTNADFSQLKEIFEHPLPAGIANGIIYSLIDDDGLSETINFVAKSNPNKDVRSVVAEWIKQYMPDKLSKLDADSFLNVEGTMSPLGNNKNK